MPGGAGTGGEHSGAKPCGGLRGSQPGASGSGSGSSRRSAGAGDHAPGAWRPRRSELAIEARLDCVRAVEASDDGPAPASSTHWARYQRSSPSSEAAPGALHWPGAVARTGADEGRYGRGPGPGLLRRSPGTAFPGSGDRRPLDRAIAWACGGGCKGLEGERGVQRQGEGVVSVMGHRRAEKQGRGGGSHAGGGVAVWSDLKLCRRIAGNCGNFAVSDKVEYMMPNGPLSWVGCSPGLS